MKWFLSLSILFLLPSFSYGRSSSEITSEISTLETAISDKQDAVNGCTDALSRRCQTLSSELADLRYEKTQLDQELALAKANERIIIEHEDAVDDIDKQKKTNEVYALASAGVATALGYKAVKACAKWPAGVALCISYTLSSIAAAYQADIYYDTSRDMNEPRLHLLDTPPTTPPDACTGSLCDPTAPSDGENPLSRITISKPDIDKFNSLLEESPECDDCMKITPDGKIKVTNPDGIKVSKSNPVVKKATDEFMADLKKNNPSLFNKLKQLEEEGKLGDEEEEVVEEVEEAFAGKFVAGKAARSVASNSSRRSSRYKDKDDSLDFKSVFDQFRKNKKNKFAGKTVTVGKDQVGVVQDNIFLMVHRRYQERRTQKQFIESQKKISKRKAALGS